MKKLKFFVSLALAATMLLSVFTAFGCGSKNVLRVYNCYDYRNLVSSFIDERWRDKHFYVQMHYKDVIECLNEKNMEFVNVYNEVHSVKKEVYDLIKQINERLGDLESDSNMIYQMLMTERYWFCIRK